MKKLVAVLPPCVLLLVVAGMIVAQDVPATGLIEGTVVDARRNPVAGAVVALLAHATGLPFQQLTGRPLSDHLLGRADGDPMALRFSVSDPDGRFTFDGLREGSYRLVAQRWTDREEPVERLLAPNGATLELLGTAGDVKVPSSEARTVVIHPMGRGSLDVDLGIPNDDSFLVVSIRPLVADPVLGFAAWSGDFGRLLIGGSGLREGRVAIRGLPVGKVSLGFFASDSEPGFGGGEFAVKDGETTRITRIELPVIARWADARRQPPARLQPLVAALGLRSSPHPEVAEVGARAGGRSASRAWYLWAAMIPGLDRVVEGPLGKVPLADLLAADAYLRLQR